MAGEAGNGRGQAVSYKGASKTPSPVTYRRTAQANENILQRIQRMQQTSGSMVPARASLYLAEFNRKMGELTSQAPEFKPAEWAKNNISGSLGVPAGVRFTPEQIRRMTNMQQPAQWGQQLPQAQTQARAQAAPLPLFTNGYYNGAGSAANMYAAQGREYDINASKWSSLRKQQAAYHSTLDQNTSQGAYYFGPGSAEQLYATAAYANAPISMPVVPVDYGGGYGYGGGGYGGGSSYVAPEPDIPRWLYGMLSWRYR